MRWSILAFLPVGLALGSPLAAWSTTQEEEVDRFVQQTPSTDGFVHVRLSPDLSDDLPAIKSQLEALPYIRVGEPADYELTTKKDFPQTLLAIDQHQGPSDWQYDFSQIMPFVHPRTIELGNLILEDYRDPLRELAAAAAHAKTLMAIGSRGAQGEIVTCIKESGPFAAKCQGDIKGTTEYLDSVVTVRNRSAAPRYVALFLVDPAFATLPLRLTHIVNGTPLAPGASAETPSIEEQSNDFPPSGRYRIVTLWSDRPFSADSLPAVASARAPSAAFIEFREPLPDVAGMGGGYPALPGMAAFIAQIYSTVPYTAADRAKDVDQVNERGAPEAAHRCGGSLIAPDLVLTAAHCVAKDKYAGAGLVRVLKERRVRISSSHLGADGTTYAIAGVAVPPEYDAQAHTNDIALLLLKADRDTAPVKIHTVSIGRAAATGAPLTIFGWGYTGEEAPGADTHFDVAGDMQRSPFDLQFGRVAALDWHQCNRRMEDKLRTGMICTVARPSEHHNVFTCVGDSGGPLVQISGKRERLVGITSWSMGCGHKDYPDVFTDVAAYRAWIDAARQQLKAGDAIRVPLPTAAAGNSARR